MFGCGAKRGKEQRQWTAMLMDESRITTEQKASSDRGLSAALWSADAPGTTSHPAPSPDPPRDTRRRAVWGRGRAGRGGALRFVLGGTVC